MADTDGMRPDWAQKDFYAVLGVKKDASTDEILRTTINAGLFHGVKTATGPMASRTISCLCPGTTDGMTRP